MTDDQWRRRREDDDFGPPLFGNEPTSEVETGSISFGEGDTGSLPHWTQPPTGEIPRVLAPKDETDDLDVWSSFGSQSSPSWRDDRTSSNDMSGLDDITGLSPVFESSDDSGDYEPVDATVRDESVPVPREPGRITIGTDPTDGAMSRPSSANRRPRPGDATNRGQRPSRPAPSRTAGQRVTGGTGGRDMPTAIAAGLIIAAVFLLALRYRPWAAATIVVLVLGLGAVEYFDRVREKGYQPAFVPGIMACVAAPFAVYHYGVSALPLVLMLAFAASAVTFIASPGLDSNPMPNMAITTLGVMWIGALGSFAAATLQYGNALGQPRIGTDTLCLVAIAVVANDVGALFVGSAVGRTPLRAWISPNKSMEGLIGGTLVTLGAMLLVSLADKSHTWNSLGDLLLLGLVVSVAAPIGDLTESMFKRNLDVKDFGSIVKGHGGVLDRFDGFLFALPAAYYLLITLHPWVTK